MNELDLLINQLIKEKGGNKKDYLNLMNSIAYHESAQTLDPTIKQIGGGPGRGKYQFEEGNHKGGITAAKRTKKYLESVGIKTPKWLEEISSKNSLDATKLDSKQQDMLFLGNMRMHPKADFKKVWDGEETIQDFWANYHWAGDKEDRPKRLDSFNRSYDEFKKKDSSLPESTPRDMSRPEMVKDNTNIKQPILKENLFANGGDLKSYVKGRYTDNNLNEFNTGGLHEQNPLGGIPQGMGSNGQQNTVEQGETSFKLNSGKFIFSDRLGLNKNPNQFKSGGKIDPIDPPIDKVNTARNFVGNWMQNPETQKRLSDNLGITNEASKKLVDKGIGNLGQTKVKQYNPNPNIKQDADFTPYNKEIGLYTEPTESILTHEFTHSLGDIDKNLSKVIQNKYGAIPTNITSDPNEKEHIKYLNRNGEFYPRLMEMRQLLNVSPGDIITDDNIETLKKDKRIGKMFKYYKPEQIKDMLNTIADNSKIQNNLT
tara:strand:- start:52976 stop:54430 length:1455 start_codon:yes stop_codon:yes gene_type:complete